MKIDNTLYASSSLPKPRSEIDDSFERVVKQNENRPALFHTKDDTDYFRLHQNDLEQSDLTFHPITPQSKPNAIPDSAVSPSLMHVRPSLVAPNKAQPLMPSDSYPTLRAQQFNQPAMSLDDTQQLTPLQKKQEHTPVFFDHPLSHQETVLKTPSPKHITPMVGATLTAQKPYHLFVTDKEAELAINTRHLAVPPTRNWYETLKQWLYTKGYSLKQLIINGVTQ